MSGIHVPISMEHSHLTIVFATSQHIPVLLTLKARLPALKMIVSIDDLPDETKRILTTWGNVQKVQVKEMRERTFSHATARSELLFIVVC